MKSSEVRKIEIKNPFLRNLRTNLRKIIRSAYESETKRLSRLGNLYREKHIHFGLVPSQEKRFFSLVKRSDALMHAFNDSICYCSSGAGCVAYKRLVEEGAINPPDRPIDLDMVWIRHYRQWVCTECYEKLYKIKICEICWDTDDTEERIIECTICGRYSCELCTVYCHYCETSYCEPCYQDHLDSSNQCFVITKDNENYLL